MCKKCFILLDQGFDVVRSLEDPSKLSDHSAAALIIHLFSSLIMIGELITSGLTFLIYSSVNLPIENPLAVLFLSFYFPLGPIQLYLYPKMKSQKLWAGQAALIIDFMVVLTAGIDLVVIEWDYFEPTILLTLILVVLNLLGIFLLTVTSAKELRTPLKDMNY